MWIYFSSFTHYSLVEPRRMESGEVEAEVIGLPADARATAGGGACAVELRIWDGGGGGEPGAAPLGRFCDVAPALCARAALANATRSPRPCSPPDGYVSAAPLLSLAATSTHGTATHPLAFSLHYEFVDARLEGAPFTDEVRRAHAFPAECARDLTTPGPFSSPRNALWYGRGGARRLRCVYRVHAESGRVALELAAVSFGRSPRCSTRTDPASGRLACVPETAERASDDAEDDTPPDFDDEEDPLRVPHLKIYEAPWPGYRVSAGRSRSCGVSREEAMSESACLQVLVACVCDNSSAPLRLEAWGGTLELELAARALSPAEDHRHLHFRGAWSRAPAPPCAALRRLQPPGGRFYLTYPYR